MNPKRALRIEGDLCRQGHPLVGENVYKHPRGHVTCKICRKESLVRYKAAEEERTRQSYDILRRVQAV